MHHKRLLDSLCDELAEHALAVIPYLNPVTVHVSLIADESFPSEFREEARIDEGNILRAVAQIELEEHVSACTLHT